MSRFHRLNMNYRNENEEMNAEEENDQTEEKV